MFIAGYLDPAGALVEGALPAPGEQLRLGGLMFSGFLVSAIVLGWLMYPLPL